MKKPKRRKTEVQQLRIDLKIMRAELESLKEEVGKLKQGPITYPPYYPINPYNPPWQLPQIYCNTPNT